MIGSMLMTLDMPGQWTKICEDAAYYYNMVSDSTTGNTPFNLFLGVLIRELMEESHISDILENEIVSEISDIILQQVPLKTILYL